jgi:uncharacterized protein (DUF433 family)
MSVSIPMHVRVDDSGVAWIDDTNVKVIEVVVDKLAHQASPEEMHLQLPHLSLAQIHAALSYYYDHQGEFDAEIARQLDNLDALLSSRGESPLLAKLRKTGRLP